MWIYEKEARRKGRKLLERKYIYAYPSLGDQMEKNGEGGACSTYGGE
jgi:hypothetical protein